MSCLEKLLYPDLGISSVRLARYRDMPEQEGKHYELKDVPVHSIAFTTFAGLWHFAHRLEVGYSALFGWTLKKAEHDPSFRMVDSPDYSWYSPPICYGEVD